MGTCFNKDASSLFPELRLFDRNTHGLCEPERSDSHSFKHPSTVKTGFVRFHSVKFGLRRASGELSSLPRAELRWIWFCDPRSDHRSRQPGVDAVQVRSALFRGSSSDTPCALFPQNKEKS